MTPRSKRCLRTTAWNNGSMHGMGYMLWEGWIALEERKVKDC